MNMNFCYETEANNDCWIAMIIAISVSNIINKKEKNMFLLNILRFNPPQSNRGKQNLFGRKQFPHDSTICFHIICEQKLKSPTTSNVIKVATQPVNCKLACRDRSNRCRITKRGTRNLWRKFKSQTKEKNDISNYQWFHSIFYIG